MTNLTKTQPQKLGFWKRIARTIEAMEKTENDYIWDEISVLKIRQHELEKEIRAGAKS